MRLTLGVIAASVATLLAAAAGCVGGVDPGGGVGDGGVGDRDDAGAPDDIDPGGPMPPPPDGSAPGDPDPEPETPPATVLELDASKHFEGTYYITGTITLPAEAAGRGVQLNIVGSGLTGNMVGFAGNLPAGTTVTYAITGLTAQSYKVQARVDATGNGTLGDPGDFDGYARGATDAPKGAAEADAIPVAASVLGVDFGIGVVP